MESVRDTQLLGLRGQRWAQYAIRSSQIVTDARHRDKNKLRSFQYYSLQSSKEGTRLDFEAFIATIYIFQCVTRTPPHRGTRSQSFKLPPKLIRRGEQSKTCAAIFCMPRPWEGSRLPHLTVSFWSLSHPGSYISVNADRRNILRAPRAILFSEMFST